MNPVFAPLRCVICDVDGNGFIGSISLIGRNVVSGFSEIVMWDVRCRMCDTDKVSGVSVKKFSG